MMHCHKCRQELPDGTVFCDRCGTKMLPENGASNGASNGANTPVPVRRSAATYPVASSSAPGQLRGRMPGQLRGAELTPATPLPTQPRARVAVAVPSEQITGDSSVRHRVRIRLTNGKTFELTGKTSYVIGRTDPQTGETPDVDLADWNGAANGVSRRHAIIHVVPSGVFIEDTDSLNETIHNEFRLLSGQRYPLADGDNLRLGALTLLIVIS
jgi:FHA domain-containing protein/zinc ribbon protein